MIRRLSVLFLFVCICAMYLPAQSVSEVSGTVQDSSGGVVPAAQVTITNVNTNAARTTQTSDMGAYSFPALPIGSYSLEVTKTGFTTYLQTGIVLQVNSNPAINVTLQLGAVSQQVEVQANAAMVETQSTGVGQVIDQARVDDLPLNGRNVTQLVTLSGGAVNENTTLGQGVNPGASVGNINGPQLNYPSVAIYSIAGGVANGTNYTLDGADFLDIRSDVGLPFPFPDAVQEFKVETSALPAEYGRHPGGTVSAITMSGSDSFHGDLFEFVRNGDMDARDFFARTRDSLKRNQYGGAIGGPIRRDKLFFFGGFQETAVRTAPTTNTTFVPTAAVLQGDFRAFLAPPCQPKQVFLKSAYTTAPNSNIIPTGDLNQIGLKILSYVPVSSDPCGKITYGEPLGYNEWQIVPKIDWQRTQKDAIFFRLFVTNYFHPYKFDNLLSTTTQFEQQQDQVTSADLGDTYLITPNVINSLRVFFNRSVTHEPAANGVPTPNQLGMNVYSPTPSYSGFISVSNYLTGGQLGIFPGVLNVDVYGISDSITMTRGSHQLSMGAAFERNDFNDDIPSFTNGRITFNGLITGNSLADLLTGNLDTWLQGGDQTGHDRQHDPSAYIEDAWRANSRLRLTAGLRWDPFLAQQQRSGILSNFSPSNYASGIVSKVFVNAPPGEIYPGDPGFPSRRSDYFSTWKVFSPRFGLVYDPRGQGRETIRAGYGIFQDSNELFIYQQMSLNWPWAPSITFPGQLSLQNPWANYPGGDPFPWPVHPPSNIAYIPGAKQSFMPLHPHLPYVQEWNLSLQKQFGKDSLVAIQYIGSKTTHQWLGYNQNQATFVPGNCIAGQYGLKAPGPCSTVANEPNRYPLPQYGIMTTMDPSGNAAYNGFMMSFNHRFAHGFSALANYTWSHCLNQGDGSADISAAYQNNFDRKADWGNCSVDRRNLVNVSLIAQSRGIGNNWTKAITGNWSLSGIFTYIAGPWVNMVDGTDVSLTANGKDRPNLIGNWRLSNPTIHEWFNIAAFQQEPAGTFGDFGRNGILGPSNANFDIGLWRDFPLRESIKLTFRFEAFNALNHVQFGVPNTTLNAGSVGQITTDPHGPRILQLAMKLAF